MEKFEQIKMLELVKVEDPDPEGDLTLIFQENKKLKIKISISTRNRIEIISTVKESIAISRIFLNNIDFDIFVEI